MFTWDELISSLLTASPTNEVRSSDDISAATLYRTEILACLVKGLVQIEGSCLEREEIETRM
jgi:hypothetical protein